MCSDLKEVHFEHRGAHKKKFRSLDLKEVVTFLGGILRIV